MLGTKIILVLSRKKLSVVKVSLVDKSTTVLLEEDLNLNAVDSLAQKITKKIFPLQVRLLLEDDVSYVVEREVPNHEQISLRAAIKNIVVSTVPEKIEEDSWDYKLRPKQKEQARMFVAFAPVMDVYKPFVEAFVEEGFLFEAVEPAQIAKERNENPVIGLATKKDIKGKDSQQLSIDPPDQADKDKASLFQVGALAAVFLGIVATIIFVVIYWQNQNSQVSEVEPSPSPALEETVVALEEDQESSAAAEDIVEEEPEEAEALDEETLADFSVQVLNGAGVAGLAGEISDRLEEEGFEVANAANADNFNYEGISVSFKEDLAQSDQLFDLISEAFSEYDVSEESVLDEDSQYDIVLTVGAQ